MRSHAKRREAIQTGTGRIGQDDAEVRRIPPRERDHTGAPFPRGRGTAVRIASAGRRMRLT